MNFLCGNWNKLYISVPINSLKKFHSRDFVGTQSVYKVEWFEDVFGSDRQRGQPG